MNKIPLIEYARKKGIDPGAARKRAIDGTYKSAEKYGRDWFVDPGEPHIDRRVKSGQYKGWREKYGKSDAARGEEDKEV